MERWTTAKLRDVCQIGPPKKEARVKLSDSDLVSFVPMNDLGVRTKSLTLNNERPLADVVRSYTYFAENDVLLAKITPCFENGKLGIARNLTNGVGFGSSEFIVIRSKGKIDPEYLFYFLSQDSFRDSGARVMTGAVGHKRVPKEFVEDYVIPLPPLPEQRRIVAFLDEAFEGIATTTANAERNLHNAQELFENYLESVFSENSEGWVEKSLDELTADKSPITYGVVKPGGLGDVRFIRGGDISQGRIRIDKLRTITKEVSEQYRRTLLRGGEILVCLVGQPGQTAVAHQELAGANIARQVGLVRLQDGVNPYFISYFLRSRSGQDALGGYTGGSVQQVINLRDLKLVKVPVPNTAVQKDIVENLDEHELNIERLKNVYKKKLAALKGLKQSLLQNAFSGKLSGGIESADDGEAVA